MSDPNFPYTLEGVGDQWQAWKIVNVEDPNRIGMLLQLPADHANAAVLIYRGDEIVASLRPNGDLRITGDLRVAGRVITSDGLVWGPPPP